MTPERVKELYFLASGVDISDAAAEIILSEPWFQKVIEEDERQNKPKPEGKE